MNQKISTGVIWNFVNLFASRGATVLFTLLLARFLAPEAFGLIAMMMVIIEFANILVASGFGAALIRSKEVSDVDLSTIFWANLGISAIVYVGLFFLAPLIAEFYNQPQLTSLTRVLGFIVFINAGRVVQVAILSRAMNFRVEATANTVGVLISGSVALWLAYNGGGAWSLVTQSLLSALLAVTILWVASQWRPKFVFSKESFSRLFKFGRNLLIEGLLRTLYQNSYILVIGRVFSAELTGLYFLAKRISHIVTSQFTAAVETATYPALSTLQDNDESLKRKYRQVIQMLMFITAPTMIAMGAFAEPLFQLFLDAKWHSAVVYLELLAIVAVLYPMHAINLNVLKVKGRSDLVLKVGLIKKSINLTLLFLSIPFGVKGIIIGQVIGSLIALIPNTYYSKKLIGYSIVQQISDSSKPIFSSLVALAIWLGVIFLFRLEEAYVLQLVVGSIIYSSLFLLLSVVFRVDGVRYSLYILKKRYGKK